MSFFTDLFKGDFSNLGTDITHSGSSLINHPDELAETVGGAAALATGGLGLAGVGPLGGLLGGAGDALGGLFGGGAAATSDAAAAGGTDALAFTGTADSGIASAPAQQAISAFAGNSGTSLATGAGSDSIAFGATPDLPPAIGDSVTGAGSLGTDSTAAPGGGSNFLSTLTDPSQWTLPGAAKGAGAAVAGGGLLMDFLRKTGAPAQQQAIQQEAGNLEAQGQQLGNYLSTGTLPPALQAKLNQATTAEKARIISGYASRGQPTDPSQNSALAQELNAVDTNAIAAMADTQTKLLQTGIQETGLSTQLYETLIKLDQGGNQQLMTAIQNFAMSLTGAGKNGGQNIKLSLGS